MSSSVHLLATALLAVLFAIAIAAAASTAALDEDFGFEMSDDLEVEFNSDNTKNQFASPPSTLTTHVGHVFHYVLPKETHLRYEAKRTNGKSLPSWLMFDKVGGIFWGVPLSQDIGKVHVLLKTVKSPAETSTYEFTIVVSHSEGPGKCLPNEESTVLALVLDRDIQAVKPKQRVIAVNNIAKFFGLSKSAFTLEPHNGDDLSDSSVILAGPGTVKFPSHKKSTAILVNVGCDGRLWENFAIIVHQLKRQARDGTITEVLSLPLVGWRVLSLSKASRQRRQTDDFGTGGSGDYEEEYYDEYDNYDDEEYDYPDKSTKAPTTSTSTTTTKATTTTLRTTTTTTTTPLPPTTTPVVLTTPLQESTTHHHRHHHGQTLIESTSITDDANTQSVSSTSASTKSVFLTSPTSTTSTTTTTLPTTQFVVATTMAATTSTESINIKPKPIDTINSLYDDDDDDTGDYDDESETIVPDLTAIDVDPKLEIATESAFSEVATTKVEVVEFIPNTTPLPSSTPPSTVSTTIVTSPPTTTTTTTLATTTESTTLATTLLEISSIPPTTTLPTTIARQTTTTKQTTTSEPINTTNVTEGTDKTTLMTTEQDTTTTVKLTTARHLTTQRPTATVTESIEYELKNFPPTIQNRLKRIATTAGKAFSYVVPKDTFTDLEDGTDLRLEFLDADNRPLNKSSWCQFNQRSREIYGLPLEEDVSRWEYVIRATDLEGAAVQDVVEILVQNHKSRRVVNHEFSLYLHVEKKWEFPHDIDWALKTLRGIGQLYRSNLSDITVRRVNYTSEPVVFVWTNDSLPKSYCPNEQIDKLFELLTANNEGDPSHALTRVLVPELRIKKVMYHGLGVCESKAQPPPLAPITPPTNFSPILRNPVDHINATVGELLVFAVPEDTFYDPEDVDSRNLKMTLLTIDRQPIPSNHWLQFDSKNKEFYGIPLPNNIGRSEYQLVCEDSGGLPASDSLVVVVHSPPRLHYNVEFSMDLVTPFESFASSANMQRKFVEKIRDLFGDQNTNHIHLSSINRGSTVVNWYNKSLSLPECPRPQIKQLKSVLVNNDGSIASRVQDVMDPEFKVAKIEFQLIGVCKGRPHIQSPAGGGKGVPIEEPPLSDHEDYMITFIIPAIIIASMLMIAGIAACVLYRRRRSGKLNVEEDGRASYGNKGIPVIFQEELEEKPEPGTKAPIILKDEKPPLAPPEYSKSGSLKLTDDSEPYQPPPPPFTQKMENVRLSRPKPTPTYRKPPPLNID